MIWLISGFAFPFGEAGSELDPEERIAPLRLLHDALLPGLIHGHCPNVEIGPSASSPYSVTMTAAVQVTANLRGRRAER